MLLLFAAGATARPATDPQTRRMTSRRRAATESQPLQRELLLGDRQSRAVCGILHKRAKAIEKIQMKRRAADKERRIRLEKVAIAERPAMKRVLNDVHYQQWEKQSSAAPVHHLRRHAPRCPPPRPGYSMRIEQNGRHSSSNGFGEWKQREGTRKTEV